MVTKCIIGNPTGLLERQRLETIGGNLIPPDPSLYVPLALSPPPSKLPSGDLGIDAGRMLWNAWRSAICKWRPPKARVRQNIGVLPTLSQIACDLRDKNIAPLSWALFSVDVWAQIRATQGPPRLTWTYSATRRQNGLAWFEEKREQYEARSALPNFELRLLWEDWREMWATLLVESPDDVPSILRIVGRFFPDRSYMDRLETAKASAKQIESKALILAREGHSASWL